MADFVAVIRRAVDGLSDNTPDLRAKVYEKARGAVLRQLESMKPRPPEEMLRRQLEKLEAAIREVEAEHAEALPPAEEAETIHPEAVVEEEHGAYAEEAPPAAEPAPLWQQPEAEQEPDHQAVEPVTSYEPAPQAPEPVSAPAWDEVPAEPAAEPVAAHEEPAPAVIVPAPAQVSPAPYAPAPARAPTLWDDESWADEGEASPAPAPAYEPVQPVRDLAPPPAAEPSPVYSPAPQPAPVLEPVSEPAWEEPAPEPVASSEPVTETYPDFVVEDPTEKYAAMEPVAIAEPLSQPAPATEWPTGGVDAGAQARIGEEEWVAPAQYEPAPDADPPTLEQETGFPVEPGQPVSDPLAWSPESQLPIAEPAAIEAEEVRADLAAPAQDYFDEPVLAARAEEPAEAAPLAPLFPPVEAKKPEPKPEDDWDLFAADLPPATPKPQAAAPAWDESPFDDVPLPASGRAEPARVEEQWEPFEDFDAYDQAAERRADRDEEDADDLLYTNVEKPARSYRIEPKRRFDFTSIGLGLLGLALVAGSGYGAWVFRDTLSGLVTGLVSSPPAETQPKSQTTKTDAGTTPAAKTETATQPAAGKPAAQETASAEPEIQKFTQRLKADGSEVDEGKASGSGSGEGKSVAEQTVASAEPATTAVPGAGTPATTTTPDAAIPVGVSQKMYLYEERVGQTSPVAIEGAVVWSLKKVTGDNGKTESVVEAQVSAPERNLSALITFKRNLDPSLPASHLVELVFSIPKDFEGGAIESVQRVALKQTEQDRGDPLIAVPAKITDDFHMIALNDYADARAFNLKLLETRDWIDIPVTYRNGRRALITMEKGTTGSEAFKTAIRDWNAEDGAQAAPAPAANGQAPAQPQ